MNQSKILLSIGGPFFYRYIVSSLFILAPLVPYTHIFLFFNYSYSTLIFSVHMVDVVEWALWGSVPFVYLVESPPRPQAWKILRHMFLNVLPSPVNFQAVIYKKKVLFCFQETKLCNYLGIGLFRMLGNDGRELMVVKSLRGKPLALFLSKRFIAPINWLLVWILEESPYINAFLPKWSLVIVLLAS